MTRAMAVAAVLAVAVVAFPRAQAPPRLFTSGTSAELARAREMALDHFRGSPRQQSVGEEIVVTKVDVDALSMAHTRVQQRIRGVPVFGGEAIVHFNATGAFFAETDNFVPDINVDTVPRLTAAAAIAGALAEYGCAECLTAPPAADLWILRRETTDHLVYRVQLRREDGTNDTAMPVIFVDAHSGLVVWRYDNLQTGSGPSLYSGTVTFGTSFNAGAGLYYMENLGRRHGTFDMATSTSSTFRLSDANDFWDLSVQRIAVDVQYGSERFLEYLQNVHGWNGLNGSGGPAWFVAHDNVTGLISSRVNYGINVNNAFWNGAGMTYGNGDGFSFSPLVTHDIVDHEMMHGVTQFTAGLIYSGESGALNESWSDVFGALGERYVRGESANTWLLGEDAYTPSTPGDALRYLDEPHRAANKGYTADDDPDHYSERYLGPFDNGGVHINSGIANKAFYLLARGGTHHRGGTMTGIGADAAARIWFLALRSYMTSSTNFAGARTATLNAAAAIYGAGSAERGAVASAWCLVGVGACAVPTADSVTPSSGSGTAQAFAMSYSDATGAASLATTWVWFNATFASSSANTCLAYYDRPANLVRLLNDAGTNWLQGAPGAAATLQNSQCAIALAASTAVPTGNTLVVTLSMTFTASFAGAKNIYMYAANASGDSGWQTRGTWTVTNPAVVTADAVTPNSGSGAAQVFALQYSDSLGAADLRTTWVWFSAAFASSPANSCMVYYDRPGNALRLINDAGSGWLSGTLGASALLQNGSCAIALGTSGASLNGTVLTLTLAMTFKGAFAGAKNVYLYADSMGGANSGWSDRGDWTVPAGPVPAVTADSMTPNSGSGATQAFEFRYSDTLGAADLRTTWVWVNATFASSPANSCLLHYDQPASTLRLLNDAGTTWLTGALGASATLQNGSCAIALATSSATPSGDTLTLRLAMTFKAPFAGDKNVYMYADGLGGATSGWQPRGTWTVTGAPVAVTADSSTPNSGTGATQSFALRYGDTLGALDLRAVWVWFNATFASSAANTCLIHYDQAANTLRLVNDAGTAWLEAAPGAGGTLQNGSCAIALAASGAAPSGNTLTLTLAMTFKAGFSGAKNIYMYADSQGGLNSGWQTRGSWTVPGAAVTADSVTPNAGSGAVQAFALQYSDTLGASDLRTVWVWFNATFASSAANTCLLFYDRQAGTLALINDAGSAWVAAALGSGTLQNSSCAIDLAASSIALSGNTATLTLAVTFQAAFSGLKNVYLYADSIGGVNSGWQTAGTWTVP